MSSTERTLIGRRNAALLGAPSYLLGVRVNRKTWLAAAVVMMAASVVTASNAPFGAQKVAATSEGQVQQHPSDPDRVQHMLDGEALQTNPQEFIEESGIAPRAGLIGPTTAERLLSGSSQASPVVVDYDLATPQFRRLSAGARAIAETRVRVNHSQKVNVLFGELYGLRVDRPEDFATGAYSTNLSTARFTNSVLYLENHSLGQMVTVVVSTYMTNYENLRSYLAGDISRVPQTGEFFSSPEGVSLYEKVEHTAFMNPVYDLRVWSARQVFPCKPDKLSSRCLYKAHQPNFTHQNSQQVVLVGMSGTLQVNRPETPGSNHRFVATFPVVKLGDGSGRVFQIGSYGPERSKQPEVRNPIDQLTTLMSEGGAQLDQSALAELKAYSFR